MGDAADWGTPELEGGFRTRIGASIVEEFVAGHDASDVLRALVQNEFDAGGNRVSVSFGATALAISGNSGPIDASRWSRLFLGTLGEWSAVRPAPISPQSKMASAQRILV